jgi:hypothetical protein
MAGSINRNRGSHQIIGFEVESFLDSKRNIRRNRIGEMNDAHVALRPIGLTFIIPRLNSMKVPLHKGLNTVHNRCQIQESKLTV